MERYEKQRPGHQLQIDVKFVEPITTDTGQRQRKFYQYTAIDDCTRLRILRIYPRSDQKTAIQFLDYVQSRLPFQVEKIQTDNGAEFQSAFHWHVLDQGIGHYLHPPRHTTAERQGGTFSPHRRRRVLPPPQRSRPRRPRHRQRQAHGMGDYYNYHRPHGGLAGQTPYERLLQKTQPHAQPVNDQQQQHNYLSMTEIAEVLSRVIGTRLSAPDMTEEEALAAGMPAVGAAHGWPPAGTRRAVRSWLSPPARPPTSGEATCCGSVRCRIGR